LQQLSASFAVLGLYGFYASLKRVSRREWRQKFLIGSLISLIIPFFLVPGTGAGFYLRLLTAETAAQTLAMMGHASLGAHDVLIFDNGIAQVDLPCAGLKSLFTGSAFFLIASLILRRALTLRWVIGYGLFVVLLLIANTARVIALIWLSEVKQLRSIAETIHTPLGLVLFVAVCICGLVILRKTPPMMSPQPQSLDPARAPPISPIIFTACLFCVLIFAAFSVSAYRTSQDLRDYQIAAPPHLNLSAVPLTDTENRFFAARQKSSAKKWRFSSAGLSGYVLAVRSGAANGLHAPEVCLLGNGISVEDMSTQPFLNNGDGGHYRWLTVDDERRTAVYWMQSRDIITDDFRKRLFSYAVQGQRDWVMVTLLFDQRHNPAVSSDKQTVETLIETLRLHFKPQSRD
jgi:exosortase O